MSYAALKMKMIAGVFCVGGVIYVADQYDKKTNYVEVPGVIDVMDETCFLEKELGKRREYSDVMNCNAAVILAASHPTWKGFDIKRNATLDVRYVDPLTGEENTVTFLEEYEGSDSLYSRGADYNLLAHIKEPGKTRKL